MRGDDLNAGAAPHPSSAEADATLSPQEAGRGEEGAAPSTYFRYNTLDEMTVGRTEEPRAPKDFTRPLKPADDLTPIRRAKIGMGSDEDKGDVRRASKRTGKTGRPGR